MATCTPRLPKKIWLDEKHYALVRVVPRGEIQGDRGEWAYNADPEDGCFGVLRIAKESDSFERWLIFREELQHALIDFQRWILYDYDDDSVSSDPEHNIRGAV